MNRVPLFDKNNWFLQIVHGKNIVNGAYLSLQHKKEFGENSVLIFARGNVAYDGGLYPPQYIRNFIRSNSQVYLGLLTLIRSIYQ